MNGIVALALRQRPLVILAFVLFVVGGLAAFQNLNIEAYPDPTPPMVDVVTQTDGLSAEEIERYVTIPIERITSGMPNLKQVRTISLYGLSDVKLQFGFEFDYLQAEQQVLNRLQQLDPLPAGAKPTISPISPIGEIFRYKLTAPPGYSVLDLRTLQEWVLKKRFRAVPGVIDAIGWGGKTKTIELSVDLDRLMAYGLSLANVVKTLNDSNLNVGGNRVAIGGQSAVVRAVGLIRDIDDINGTVLTQVGGAPVLVKDVATVTIGHQPRLGIAGMNDEDDIVQGIVLMRRGEKSTPSIEAVKVEVAKIEAAGILPPGVKIERIYDRADLIAVTTHTVLHNMVVGILLILAIQWLFLGNLRSALIVVATIPFALFFAVVILVARNESANLLSVGALDFGLIVDGTVIMVEAIFRRLSGHGIPGYPPPGLDAKSGRIALAASDVSRSIFFAAAIIVTGFLPLFTLTGVEGHIFGPMATTYAYALLGGLIATFTVTPALAAYLLPAHIEEKETILVRALDWMYRPAVRAALGARLVTVACVALIAVGVGLAARNLGSEFLPKLEEGNLWVRATMPATISLRESNGYVNEMRKIIASLPEVERVVSQHGRPDDGTDAAGFFNAEFFAPMKPLEQWRPGVDKEKLTEEMLHKLQAAFPGVDFNLSQYLQDNVAEAVSGIKGENSFKIFGNDLQKLTDSAKSVMKVLSTVRGVEDLAVFQSLGQPTIEIDVDRVRAARYGLTPGDINTTVRTAIGGDSAGDLYDPGSERHYPIMVRLQPQFRQSIEAIANLRIAGQSPANGAPVQFPLSAVARVELVSGPAYIYREAQERYLPVKFSVRGRDLGSTIEEARARVANEVTLPPGYRLELVGEFNNMKGAIARLSVTVPIAVGIIAILLFMNFSSVVDSLLALSVIPMAMAGGILALSLTGTSFSVSAAIGFIALLGIAVMDGIIVLSFYNDLLAAGVQRVPAMLRTCYTQMRPVVMTCVVAGVGLLPAAFSTGVGSQVQKPLALVVVGGMALAPLLILLVLPVLILTFSRRKPAAHSEASDRVAAAQAHSPAEAH
ncbi:UNVERIFIED_ORG: cobalt-zinc-cadmium resistance protein CzcA [Methylobacterium sp. SuP10 SLI 274]|uniref:efflux RND transporter permease subunit n=1 Tax=Methylorubrum extorquens TaxID=408 RepID=UPI00209F85B6|nr:CusA/CzcA family heavy metal efflux RND transporter [Methylorubrum extorquens]MDF9861429.1 cobalt-zinc-cadmium resistance protein CzcA [Methylorubrum pseudosasae]MDH6635055.1 cobalt-zinc-cadmium resistance protein CzcA [Methylobacterium sp. SuP10 SLI 274]MDH6664227.1 cobalt-zinc-cadmium resistance protein CzcA [Methylorubrum zatmanii]MCP1561230.1 cobalt-zinc-cadmium resistance protein CzcA [Methylorubrum extorquens]MDF9789717.1 cobalt-zinc-cadmium resistance protein CzcA [Methylorubrum exto